MSEFITPPSASPGDDIAVIAPSSGGAAVARHVFSLGLQRLRNVFDLNPVVDPTARQSDAFLRDHPRARAAAIHAAFRDPEISAVMATIGGDDQLRVLRHLDPEILRDHPTRFYGMSDNTNLALFLWTHGIVSFYGGQLLNQIAVPGPLPEYTKRYVRRALFEESLGTLESAGEWADLTVGWDREDYATTLPAYEPAPDWTWAGGDTPVAGRIWGGCLTVLDWQLMTDRYLPDPVRLDGAILALETSEELPSADRMSRTLMCLGERGLLQRFDGVLVGRPATQTWREERSAQERTEYRSAQREAIRDQLSRYNSDAPIVFDLDFGHTTPTAPLPIGGRVRIEPSERIVFP